MSEGKSKTTPLSREMLTLVSKASSDKFSKEIKAALIKTMPVAVPERLKGKATKSRHKAIQRTADVKTKKGSTYKTYRGM